MFFKDALEELSLKLLDLKVIRTEEKTLYTYEYCFVGKHLAFREINLIKQFGFIFFFSLVI